MAEDDDDSKSEQPTGRRISKARDEGDINQSQEVKTAAMLVAIAVFVWLIAPISMGHLRIYLTRFLEEPHAIRVGSPTELEALSSDVLSMSAWPSSFPSPSCCWSD